MIFIGKEKKKIKKKTINRKTKKVRKTRKSKKIKRM